MNIIHNECTFYDKGGSKPTIIEQSNFKANGFIFFFGYDSLKAIINSQFTVAIFRIKWKKI